MFWKILALTEEMPDVKKSLFSCLLQSCWWAGTVGSLWSSSRRASTTPWRGSSQYTIPCASSSPQRSVYCSKRDCMYNVFLVSTSGSVILYIILENVSASRPLPIKIFSSSPDTPKFSPHALFLPVLSLLYIIYPSVLPRFMFSHFSYFFLISRRLLLLLP